MASVDRRERGVLVFFSFSGFGCPGRELSSRFSPFSEPVVSGRRISEDVAFDVHKVVNLRRTQVGVRPRERDDLHVEMLVVDAGDRQADAVDGYRALADDIAASGGGILTVIQ